MKPSRSKNHSRSKQQQLADISREIDSLKGRLGNLERIKKFLAMPYAEYLETDHWQATRRRALRYYGYKCHRCLASSQLEVHHKHYNSIGQESHRYDLEVLCRDCHQDEHTPMLKPKALPLKIDTRPRLIKKVI
jgi:5-methylcytosine-specific restriction endonuclease McrA